MIKYKFTGKTKYVRDRRVHQIVSVIELTHVGKGVVGGWLESEANLSHYDNCWVASNSIVYEYARVADNAFVGSGAEICGHARLSGDASVNGGHAGKSIIRGTARLYGRVHLCGVCIDGDVCIAASNSTISWNK